MKSEAIWSDEEKKEFANFMDEANATASEIRELMSGLSTRMCFAVVVNLLYSVAFIDPDDAGSLKAMSGLLHEIADNVSTPDRLKAAMQEHAN